VLAVVGLVWGAVALWNAPIFAVQNVTVSGQSHLKKADILAMAAVPKDATLIRLPT
jgi:cell division septal protein FtsQ